MAKNYTSKKDDKRSKLIEAAFTLFSKKDGNGASVDEITQNANVAKGTFYLYFKDKKALVSELVRTTTFNALMSSYRYVLQNEKSNFEENLILFVDYLIDFLSENKSAAKLIGEHFSWSSFKREFEINDQSPEFAEFIDNFIKNSYRYSKEEAIKLLFVILSVTFSMCYDAVSNNSADTVEALKPTVHMLIQKMM